MKNIKNVFKSFNKLNQQQIKKSQTVIKKHFM